VSGTTWAVTYDGAALTWERLVALWYQPGPREAHDRPLTWEAHDRPLTNDLAHGPGGSGRYLQEACPLEFDVADGLSSRQAQLLVAWLAEWMPRTARGVPDRVRLVPSVSTGRVASDGRFRPQQVRL
jgi:hypothetical protein